MNRFLALSPLVALSVSCSTLDQSFRLGAATGAVAGAAATYGAERVSGGQPSFENVAVGASVGLALGLITSYFVHQSVSEDREDSVKKTEMYFGDLPPSPFIIPNQKGGR